MTLGLSFGFAVRKKVGEIIAVPNKISIAVEIVAA